MRGKFLLFFVLVQFFNTLNNASKAQSATVINQGSIQNFVIFSSVGTINNKSTKSTFIGNIGSNVGAETGFTGGATVYGKIVINDDSTRQGVTDLDALYDQLINLTITKNYGAATTLGANNTGETLTEGVYNFSSSTKIKGNLTLDAQNDPNAKFVFLVHGDLAAEAASSIILANGADFNNIYWVTIGGGITSAANATIKGNLVAQTGDINFSSRADIQGRILSLNGSITFTSGIATRFNTGILPVELVSFTGNCTGNNLLFKWITSSELNNQSFTLEQSADGKLWSAAGKVPGAGNSSIRLNYSFTNLQPISGTGFYRLKQTDIDGKFKYSQVIPVTNCGIINAASLSVYPNPSKGNINVLYSGNKDHIASIDIIDNNGKKIYSGNNIKPTINFYNQAPGAYTLRLYIDSKVITTQFIIQK